MLELLESTSYNVDDYKEFSINEVDAMYKSSQLDMLIKRKTDDTKVYIKYHISPGQKQKQMQKDLLNNIIDDLFVLEEVLTKKDTLIIIMDDEPNESTINNVTYLYDKEEIFIVIHNLKRLQFNILNHRFVPKIKVLTDEEKDEMMREKNIQDISQIPEISRFDPQALAIMLRPKQVCRIFRISPTALETTFYRVCV
jgi:DNA-directed RNA polymerase subunit H (RpoH/RPB5)